MYYLFILNIITLQKAIFPCNHFTVFRYIKFCNLKFFAQCRYPL
jgi:hypothetical protein